MQNNNRVIVFYDPPHLLKNIHNNLKKLSFKVGENNIEKLPTMLCSKSAVGLVGLLNKAKSSHVFIAAMHFQVIPTGDLVVPNSDFDRSRIP